MTLVPPRLMKELLASAEQYIAEKKITEIKWSVHPKHSKETPKQE